MKGILSFYEFQHSFCKTSIMIFFIVFGLFVIRISWKAYAKCHATEAGISPDPNLVFCADLGFFWLLVFDFVLISLKPRFDLSSEQFVF